MSYFLSAEFRSVPFRSVSFRASELALPRNSECLGMSTFFRGITETVPSLFCGIFSERNSVPNPTLTAAVDNNMYPVQEYTLFQDIFCNPYPFWNR